MPDAPPLPRTELPLVKERIRDAWRSVFPDVDVPAALLASERPIQAVSLAERTYSGLLVALWLDPAQAEQLTIDGGEPADALHLTLAYCPDMAETDEVTLARIVASLADVAATWTELTGRVGGFGRFYAGDGSDGQDVFIALPDIAMLDYLRESVLRALGDVWVYAGSEHSFQPHITLAYLPAKAKTPAAPPAIELTFSGITVVAGERRIDIPFRSSDEPTYIGMFDGPYAYYAERTATQPRTGRAKEAWRFSSPRRFADAQGWIQALPPPGSYHHSLWGRLEFTPDRYDRMLANFRDGVYAQTLPINAEHDLDASGAIGWITDMRLGADGSIEVQADWNDRGQALLDGDRFRYVSAEWWNEWQDPVSGAWIPDVFSGLAICTHPHFKTDVLRPLAASELDTLNGAGTARQEGTGVPDDATNQTPPATGQAVQLNEAELTAFRQFQELGGAARLTELEGKVQSLSERNANLESDARKKRFADIVRGRAEGAEGVAWRGDAQRHVAHMTRLAEAFGDESPELKDYIADRTADAVAFAEAVKPLMTAAGTSREGDGGPTAEEQIRQRAQTLRESEPALTEAQAVAKAYEQAPADLKRAYRAQRPVNRAGGN